MASSAQPGARPRRARRPRQPTPRTPTTRRSRGALALLFRMRALRGRRSKCAVVGKRCNASTYLFLTQRPQMRHHTTAAKDQGTSKPQTPQVINEPQREVRCAKCDVRTGSGVHQAKIVPSGSRTWCAVRSLRWRGSYMQLFDAPGPPRAVSRAAGEIRRFPRRFFSHGAPRRARDERRAPPGEGLVVRAAVPPRASAHTHTRAARMIRIHKNSMI